MLAMRAYQREKHVDGRINHAVLRQVQITQAEVEEMYRVMAIANYEDRFVIPTTHREYAGKRVQRARRMRLQLRQRLLDGINDVSLFGSEKKRTIPIKAEISNACRKHSTADEPVPARPVGAAQLSRRALARASARAASVLRDERALSSRGVPSSKR